MFDIGFPELLLVSVVALLVIGPDRLPETVRSIMIWLGKLKRSFENIKTELEQEIGVDEIRQQIHNDSIMKDLEKSRQQINDVIDDVQEDINLGFQEGNLDDFLSPNLGKSDNSNKEEPISPEEIESKELNIANDADEASQASENKLEAKGDK